jgi:universal stress protein A
MITILVPVDYSDHSLDVLEFAARLARRLKARLSVLHVWETMPHFSPDLRVTTPSGPQPLNERVHEVAVREMKDFLAQTRGIGSVPFETLIGSGPAATAILQVIAERGFDLVIAGTHGRGGLKHWVLGSVAEHLVRSSPAPVITVPAGRRDVASAGQTSPRPGANP